VQNKKPQLWRKNEWKWAGDDRKKAKEEQKKPRNHQTKKPRAQSTGTKAEKPSTSEKCNSAEPLSTAGEQTTICLFYAKEYGKAGNSDDCWAQCTVLTRTMKSIMCDVCL